MKKAKDMTIAGAAFEQLRQKNAHGAEYWSARALQPLLGYSQWRRFEQAVQRAITSCKKSGNPPPNHFAGVGKMIDVGKGGLREVDDYQLSRFACYLIAQNGGLGNEAIKRKKAIPEKENLMDRMNATELAANQFRMTQTRDKLARDEVRNQTRAIQTHEQVGREVRDAIKRIGGTLPESLPADEHIKQVEKRLKSTPSKLALDEKESIGLLGEPLPENPQDHP